MPIKLLSSAVKRIAAMITTAAALLVLLVNAKNLGLDTWLGAKGLNFASAAVRRIVVTPRSDSLFAVGDTLALAATVTDKHGATVAGVSILWQSNDTTVASVDSGGTVVARGPGTAVITTSVRDILATARVTVSQRPTGVAVVGDSMVAAWDDDTIQLLAHVVDARGAPVRDQFVRWETADSSIVSVDSLGQAIAVEPGLATLVATWEDHRASVLVEVALKPATIALISGDGQRAAAGHVLETPVEVRLLSRDGRPVPMQVVTFLPPRDGRVEPDTAMTDRDGRARATWTLGPRPGRQRLMARVAELDSALAVIAEADPVQENTRVARVGGDTAAPAGALIAQPIAIRVTDSLGRVLDDLPVTWTAQDGGAVEPLEPRTNSLGMAAARWTLGPETGSQRLMVQVGDPRTLAPVTLTVTAVPGPAAAIRVAAGDAQRGTAGQPLPQPVVVQVSDALGNPVAGVAVSIEPRQGSVPDSGLVSDSAGRVRLRWTLGSVPGAQFLELRAAGVDTAARVTAQAAAARQP